MSVLLDTHAWLWWLVPGDQLPRRVRDRLDELASRSEVYLSAISLWEAQMAVSRGRVELAQPFAQWIVEATDPALVKLVPLDIEVAIALGELPASFHGDPADRLIAATSRCKRLPLATWDKALRRSRSIEIWKG